MASGRVGGTRSKIRGVVGDNVYQVRRNEDGTYSQLVYGKTTHTINNDTPRLQCQRMVASMVEALMRDLRPIGCISWQDSADRSKSLNAMSGRNLELVLADAKDHWFSGNQFLFPMRSRKGTPAEALGGRFAISQGTLTFDLYDEVVYCSLPSQIWDEYRGRDVAFTGIRFSALEGSESVGHFLQRHRITRKDKIVLVYFKQWYVYDGSLGEDIEHTGYGYVVVHVSPDVPDDEVLSEDNMNDLFICESNDSIKKAFADNYVDYYIGAIMDGVDDGNDFWYYTAFSISYLEGKKRVSTKFLVPTDDAQVGYLTNAAPADVLGSWMGNWMVRPWPYIW